MILDLSSLFNSVEEFKLAKKRIDLILAGLENLPENVKQDLSQIIGEHNLRIWNSQGGEIGENWNGRTLVKTGNLKSSMTTERLILNLNGVQIVWESDASYAEKVNENYKFIGASQTVAEQAAERIKSWVINGN